MALYDDPRFLVSHIRHSFRTSDESRMYELAMVTDLLHQPKSEHVERLSQPSSPASDFASSVEFYSSNDSELRQIAHSCDIVRDNELIGAHRRRSNTAQRLDKLKKERKLQAKIKRITLRNPPLESISQEPAKDLFASKEVPKKITEPKVTSLLSQLLITRPLPVNPFASFARLDSRAQGGAKVIKVFMPMLPERERDYPLIVACHTSTKVHDLIGLICWQYTSEEKKPELKPDIKYYCLRFAEETGEVEDEFPSVDLREPIGKYDFPSYQLQEVENPPEDITPTVVTFHIKDVFSKVHVTSVEVTLREAVGELFKRRKGLIETTGSEYTIERRNEPGVPLDLDSRLNTIGALEYNLVTDSSNKNIISQRYKRTERQVKCPEMRVFSMANFQTYAVQMIQKIGKNVTVQLAVSSEKIEITPLPQKSVNKLLWQVKPATHNIREIAGCELLSRKNGGDKRCFKIVYYDNETFRDYMFETANDRASDITEQINCILQMKSSEAQKLFKLEKQKKLSRKPSFLSNPFG